MRGECSHVRSYTRCLEFGVERCTSVGCVLLLICHGHVEGILGLVCYLVLHLDKFLLTAVFVEFDLVAIGVDLKVKLEVAAFFCAWLRVEELFIIRLCQEFLIP